MKLNIIPWILLVLSVVFFGIIVPVQKKLLEYHNKQMIKTEAKILTKNEIILVKEAKDVVYVVKTKEIKTRQTHDENSTKIEQTQGSADVINPELISTINGGLCKYKDTVGCP